MSAVRQRKTNKLQGCTDIEKKNSALLKYFQDKPIFFALRESSSKMKHSVINP